MKKLAAFVLALVCLLGLSACDPNSGKNFDVPDDLYQFGAKILEIHDDYFLVAPNEGTTERDSTDKIEVSTRNADRSVEWKVGDYALITYNGEILETYPGQLGQVYKVEKLELEFAEIKD